MNSNFWAISRVAGLLLITPFCVGAACMSSRGPDDDGGLVHLRDAPELSLAVPGATELQRFENPRGKPNEGEYASIAIAYGVDVPGQEILSFYDRELRDRGWLPSGNTSITSTESAAYSWKKDDKIARVAIEKPGRVIYSRTPALGQTVFTFLLWLVEPFDG